LAKAGLEPGLDGATRLGVAKAGLQRRPEQPCDRLGWVEVACSDELPERERGAT
jgi:hypothetical protein